MSTVWVFLHDATLLALVVLPILNLEKHLQGIALKEATAAAHDHAVSHTLLGYMHEKGIGVLRDYDKSLRYYERAATQQFDIAERNLGCLRSLISRMHNRGDRSDND